MAETLKNHDFIEINYTGKLQDGKVFDTTVESVAKENAMFNPQIKYESFKLCLGEKQVLPGLDAALVGKEVGSTVTIDLAPEDAFGKKDVKKIQLVPIAAFKEHNMRPQPGMQVDFDGKMGVIMRINGGRVMVNFNHPLAGRPVQYEVTIIKKITDKGEQINSYLGNIFRQLKNVGEVDVKGEEATIKMPFELPPQFTDGLCEKLQELTGLKKVAFAVDEAQKKAHEEALQKAAKESHEGHVHGPNCNH